MLGLACTIEQSGEAVRLTRTQRVPNPATGFNTETVDTYDVFAQMREYKDNEINGIIMEGDLKIFIPTQERLTVVPEMDENVEWVIQLPDNDTAVVQSIKARRTNRRTVGYEMRIR